ncbi:hypothetical protein Pmar_PMAR018547 [Perkinsus marinus ATCC 50983]|uniref:Uncharacterized protein n=1 Tax=Perkinsus marinus (strain ATCC 50983 / TXsc) TaxID=423536 RepID=C5L045_PERM5|nr:hypothetical protein Pmar_PMAR018547 [Perkinsus marinus ATCC 50983]EER09903.1 hypothetical protein Pmar_PMAR018547 [Perkinsus marinus ATCC 50983]|eukprot:XP_002778108.1 hypothetical protein Pmar_PMAR018547 [Perkinsus marinus ATCC 50983]
MPIKIKLPNGTNLGSVAKHLRSSLKLPLSVTEKLKAFKRTETGAKVSESWAHTKEAAYDAYIKNPACYRGGGGSVHTRGKPGTPSYYRAMHPQRITYQFNDQHRQKEYDEFLANRSAIPMPRGQARGVSETFYKDS